MKQKKLAIACQGGGSQTAFTAGVLRCFLENRLHEKRQIVSLSGTSGGAVCATLAWTALVKASKGQSQSLGQGLVDFWQDNATGNWYEQVVNDALVIYLGLVDGGLLPRWEISPNAPYAKAAASAIAGMAPKRSFYDFKELLQTHIDFNEIASWKNPPTPALLIGAADVIKGEFKKFSSLRGEIQVEALLASAAVPSLFPAVVIDEHTYWDGLFSDNPPVDELLDEKQVGKDNLPEELWVIQINPKGRETVPTTSQDITDRRNEMIGNVSLYQDLSKIELINRLLEKGAFSEAYTAKYRPVDIHIVEMSTELQKRLDYASKLNRDAGFINGLIKDGEKQGHDLLARQGLLG
jgi:NTE family protein